MSRYDEITRRGALRAGLAALALPAATGAAPEEVEIPFGLVETAGLRRFSFPVHAVLPRPSAMSGARFRLLRDGRPVPAQFREVVRPDGGPAIALDFNASPGPRETERYVVLIGKGAEPGPEPKGGMRVERVGDVFRVSHGSTLAFTVPVDLLGLLKGVSNAKNEFVAEGSEGLVLRLKDGTLHRTGGSSVRGTVAREGPVAVALRFEGAQRLGGERAVRSAVEMTFPNSKSWVETTWTVEDPEGIVAALGVDVRLKVDGAPTLVDLGASSTVYGQIRGDDAMELAAGSAPDVGRTWVVRKGPPGKMTSFAEAPTPDSPPAEGWAHVMDRTRCTALAVADFGRQARDRIEVLADGRVRIWREFAAGGEVPSGRAKALTFWFHFVGMPVQVGAATSPQAMLAPLKVAWE